ncbi:MAG: S9 family peptidase [Bacteroidia bacterium]
MKRGTTIIFFLLAGLQLLNAQGTKQITLEDIFVKRTFRQDYVGGFTWCKDGQHYMNFEPDQDGMGLYRFEIKSGKKKDLVFHTKDLIPEGSMKPVEMDNFSFSPDESKVLISTETEHIYRYSSKEENYVLDLKTKKMKRLSTSGKQRLAAFSPDSKKVAFVRDNNIFITDLETGKETQVTNDGEWNKIINGGTDWVYEEEFALPNGLYWSPDSKRIAYYKFDESRVKEFQMTMYNTGLYPQPYSYKYPKAGEDNSIVTIHVYDLNTQQSIPVDIGKETNQYIPRVQWTNDPNTLSLMRMNRLQNKLELLLSNVNDGTSKVVLTENSKTYIEIPDCLTFLKDGKSFIWSNDNDGNTHLYVYGMDGKMKSQLTKGAYDVITFYGINEKNGTLYYQSNEGNPVQRDVYAVSLDGSKKKKLSVRQGSNSANFSTGMLYYINYHSSANTPSYITTHESSGKELKVLKTNTELIGKMQEYGFSKKEFFSFKNRDGIELMGWMIKPLNMDPNKKYPVLMHVYGGPGHNTVVDQFDRDLMWHQMLAQKGYIVVSVDNRGTEYRGSSFKKATYGKMGELESADQIDAAKYLGTLPYVDKGRIGIQGWSYGGYMSSLCLAVGADYFKMAISIAPVSNWRYYDSIYTERYMGLPKDNAEGYDKFSPTHNMEKLRGKLLLVHGTADDNVHYQNSVELVNALIKANKQFEFYMYPDQNHGIGQSRYHLYTKMTEFILANL